MEVELTYDKNGNLITGDGKYREYNEFNQLVRVRAGYDQNGRIVEEYLYHPTEERILAKKVYDFDQNWRETIIYVNENLVRKINASGTYDSIYVKDEQGIVAEKKPDGSKIFYHNDHLGSTTLITNESGGVVENTFYEPYGGILSGGTTSRFDYEGKEFSSGTSDYDFHFRKYDSGLKRFTQPDSLIQNVYDPQELNRYSFEVDNPLKSTDPTGHEPVTLTIGIAAIFTSALLGFTFGAVTSYYYQKQAHGTVDMGRVWKSAWIGAGLSAGMAIAFLATAGTAMAIGTSAGSAAKVLGTEIAIDIGSSVGLEYLEDMKKDDHDEEWSSDMLKEYNKRQYRYVSPYGQGSNMAASYFRNSYNNVNQQQLYYQTINNLIGQMREAGSASGVGGSGYYPGIGYVTPEGKTYPTDNPKWRPNPNAPHY